MSLMFTKETVGTVQPAASLLSSTLASSGGVLPRGSHSELSSTFLTSTHTTGGGRSSITGDISGLVPGLRPARALPSFSVAQVISGVLNQLSGEALGLVPDMTKYDLRIAEDDGSVDPDFPSVDLNVPITSVGVDKFVLCEIATDLPMLRICIPAQNVQLRVCEAEDAPHELTITCYQPLTSSSTAIGFASVPGRRPGVPGSMHAPDASPIMESLSAAMAASHVGMKKEPSSPTMGPKQFTVKLRGLPAVGGR